MTQATEQPRLQRRLGARDASLIVMGGIIGSGIFVNPSRVARFVHTGPLVMLAWAIGGAIALIGAGVFAELAARRPQDGGVYAYLRDAFHPVVAFSYGWTLLLISQGGGAAASAVTFAFYIPAITGIHLSSAMTTIVAVSVIALFTLVNCLGVRQGASTQNAFMIAKLVAIVGVVGVGIFAIGNAVAHPASNATVPPFDPFVAIGLALVPVMFAYSGWQTSSFMSAELRDPQRNLARGMLYGVLGVVVLYLAVNAVCLIALGQDGLARTDTPASDVVRAVFGPIGGTIMATIVAISTLGFITNQILTAPRVYYQMAADGTFFSALAKIDPRTHVPVVAIAVQGIAAMLIAMSGKYDVILNWVTSIDYIFFGFAALALVIFRRRDAASGAPKPFFTIPLHPWSTGAFLVVAWAIVLDVLVKSRSDTLIGFAVLLTGIPVYFAFRRKAARER
ncbi:MAG: amino acid permease [bacterium]|nr:amino acid permease [bacterium]